MLRYLPPYAELNPHLWNQEIHVNDVKTANNDKYQVEFPIYGGNSVRR